MVQFVCMTRQSVDRKIFGNREGESILICEKNFFVSTMTTVIVQLIKKRMASGKKKQNDNIEEWLMQKPLPTT